MRRLMPAGIALLAVAVVLSACGLQTGSGWTAAATDAPPPTIKLTIMHNWTVQEGKATAYRRIMEQFRASHPDVVLEEEGLTTDGLKSRIRTVAAADEMPDLFVMWPDAMTSDFVRGDLIQPIDDFLDSHPAWKNGFIPHALDDFTVNGRIYTVPMNLAPSSLLFYNEALFDRYGLEVPRTWAELLEAIRVFQQNGIIPIALGNKSNWVAQSTIFSALADRVTGTEWFAKAIRQEGAAFTDPVFVEALGRMRELAQAGAFQPGFGGIDDTEMMQLYADGKAAMFINGGWALSTLLHIAQEAVLAYTHVTVLPPVPGGRGEAQSTSGVVGTGLGVNKKLTGAKKQAALELLYALSGPEGQQATLDSSTLVSYQIQPDRAQAHPLFLELHELMQRVRISPVYDIKLSSSAVNVVNAGIQELLAGDAEPEEVAQRIQQAQAAAMHP